MDIITHIYNIYVLLIPSLVTCPAMTYVCARSCMCVRACVRVCVMHPSLQARLRRAGWAGSIILFVDASTPASDGLAVSDSVCGYECMVVKYKCVLK